MRRPGRAGAAAAARFLLGSLFGLSLCLVARADDWPQWLGPQRDGVWRETGILRRFPAGGPPVRWRTPIGAGYAGPAVHGDRVFVTDRVLAERASNPASAFDRGKVPGAERVHSLDAATGRVLWTYRYDCAYDISYPAGPRTTPLVADGKVFTLGAMGHLACLEAGTGRRLWSREFMTDYGVDAPMWGFAAHPLLDGERLICLARGDGSTVVAFDKDTGRELWRALSAKEPGYCPPVIYEAGGTRQLIVWHPESLNALDPATGQLLWSQPFAAKAGLTVAMPRLAGDRLLVSSFYEGSMLMRLDATRPVAELVWRGQGRNERNTDGLHALIVTPVIDGDYLYGVCSYGQLRCLKLATGERVWETLAPVTGQETRWGTAFLVRHENRYFVFNERGDLLLARLSPQGYEELGRTHLLEPTNTAAGRDVVWSHPAFARRAVFARNDREIVCVSLAE